MENWMIAKKKQNSLDVGYKFITNILNKMKLSTEHRQNKKHFFKEIGLRKRHPGIWDLKAS